MPVMQKYGLTREELLFVLDPAELWGAITPRYPPGSKTRRPGNLESTEQSDWFLRRGIGCSEKNKIVSKHDCPMESHPMVKPTGPTEKES